MTKYSDLLMQWLNQLGYTHCFFVAGGNSMHLLDGARRHMTCVPFVHEVAAGIAAEFFNEVGGEGRAFVLVTAGPGLTNVVTAMAGAFLESRELLVLGGQVKSTDLATGGIRQRGIQEIDGVSIAAPVSVRSTRFERPASRSEVAALVEAGRRGRPGPVFLEICLDVQGAPVDPAVLEDPLPAIAPVAGDDDPAEAAARLAEALHQSERPVLLLGGGVRRDMADEVLPRLREIEIPTMTTWNGADRVGSEEPFYFGRPNTWGRRSSNVLLQQADLVVAMGTRLGLQQTGFNWQQFAPKAVVAQVEIDRAELDKGHPRVDLKVHADANEVLRRLVAHEIPSRPEWLAFCSKVRDLLPLAEPWNTTAEGYLDPYRFTVEVSSLCGPNDVIVPCSSGGAYTVNMQVFQQQRGQVVISDKGLASMGYGLSGAIGAALAAPDRRVVLFEGDGGFAQNLQELGIVAVNDLDVKTFLLSNEGYASIRMTQRNYFDGAYLGCDIRTGLGFPHWPQLFASFGIPVHELRPGWSDDAPFHELFDRRGPAAFVVHVDPEQTYFPKITSRVTESGSMESQPLHLMTPDLPDEIAREVFVYL